MEAKNTIEKVKEQIAQLQPIDERAKQLEEISYAIENLKNTRDLAVYWFAKKNVELAEAKIVELDEKLTGLKGELAQLDEEKERLKQQERDLSLSIENDDVGRQIKDLAREIKALNNTKQTRQTKLNSYNHKAAEVGLSTVLTAEVFVENRETARIEKAKCQTLLDEKNEELRLAKNRDDKFKEDIEENIAILQTLQKNKNNISGREAAIREEILAAVGATTSEIPFVGELIRVKDDQ